MADKIVRLAQFKTLKAQIDEHYVAKVDGKGLSTEDYTTDEKNKLAGIEEGANNYSLPTASATEKGGIKVGSNLSITADGVLNASQPDLTPYTKDATLHKVAKSGDYNDLINKPTIPTVPTKVSAFTNDAGYLTEHQSLAAYAKSADVEATYAKKSDVASAVKVKGSVDSFDKLPTTSLTVGDMYNIVSAGGKDVNGTAIKAGDNVVWNGTGWDDYGGTVDLSAYQTKDEIADEYMKKADYPEATDADIIALFTDPAANS